jgi:23S rRNA (cytosine1962-C5)-methyltransferase
MAKRPSNVADVTIGRKAADAAGRGHPWIWREGVLRGLGGVQAGDEVQVVAEDGRAVGRAVADPTSPIALRLWTRGRRPIDAALVRERLASALERRERLFEDGATNAYRVLHGEGDRCPGLVVDRYGDVAVVRVDGEAATARLDAMSELVWEAVSARGVRSLVHRPAKELRVLFGSPPPDSVHVVENGVPFVVDLARGQKTGAFLDQRDNRQRVRGMARGRRVLNLFSYAGGFSLYAALGGAVRVTSVDIAQAAHATAQASFKLAGVDPRAHAFVAADAFAFLADAQKRGDAWDLVVCDPPSFAPNAKSLPRALSAYRALHRACAAVLAPGGILCAASCSSHVDAVAFASTLDDAALEARELSLVAMYGPPPDHPTLAAWPEGRYLKFAVLA